MATPDPPVVHKEEAAAAPVPAGPVVYTPFATPGDIVRKHVIVNGSITGCFSTGTIVALHEDGSVDVVYPNGECEVNVEQSHCQVIHSANAAAAAAAVAPEPPPPAKRGQKRPILAASQVPTGDEEQPEEASREDKHLRRMQRNRESAQQSRERKKAYVDTLEAKVEALEDRLQAVQRENSQLKHIITEAGLVLPQCSPQGSDVSTLDNDVAEHEEQYVPEDPD